MNEVIVKNLYYTVLIYYTIEILKKNKERVEKKVNHSSINVSWCTDDDKVKQ